MNSISKTILDQALELPANERVIVAEQLLMSLDNPDPKMGSLWAKEAESRIDAYERGEIETKSIGEVFAKYDKK